MPPLKRVEIRRMKDVLKRGVGGSVTQITQSSPLVWKNYEHASITAQLYKVLSCNDLESYSTQQGKQGSSYPHFTHKKMEAQKSRRICPMSWWLTDPKHRVQAEFGSHLSLFQKLWEDLTVWGFLAKLHILGHYRNPGYGNSPNCASLPPLDPLPTRYEHQHRQYTLKISAHAPLCSLVSQPSDGLVTW